MIPLYTQEEFDSSKSRQLLPLQCKHCGKTFYKEKNEIHKSTIKGRREGNLFCSLACKNNSQKTLVKVICHQCGFTFERRLKTVREKNFCSHSCHATYSNTHKTKGTRCSKLERWLATKLPELYPDLEFHFNRKDAINSELDIFLPSLRLAFELNGIFHYEPIFGPDQLSKIQNNDNRKYEACIEAGIELCIIDTSTQKYFKEQSSIKFLKIIQDIISLKTLCNTL